jgi:hypothetical protein
MSYWVTEDQIQILNHNQDDEKRYLLGYGEAYEVGDKTTGSIYKAFRKEYGRCVSKVYIDTPDGGVHQIGWVFQSRRQYDNSKETYILEVWISVMVSEPKITTTYEYVDLAHPTKTVKLNKVR